MESAYLNTRINRGLVLNPVFSDRQVDPPAVDHELSCYRLERIVEGSELVSVGCDETCRGVCERVGNAVSVLDLGELIVHTLSNDGIAVDDIGALFL